MPLFRHFSPLFLFFLWNVVDSKCRAFSKFFEALLKEIFFLSFSFTAFSDTAFSKTLVGILDGKKFITAENRNKVGYK